MKKAHGREPMLWRAGQGCPLGVADHVPVKCSALFCHSVPSLSVLCGSIWGVGFFFFLLNLVASVTSVKFLMDSAAMQSDQGQQHPVQLSTSSKINYLTAQISKIIKS